AKANTDDVFELVGTLLQAFHARVGKLIQIDLTGRMSEHAFQNASRTAGRLAVHRSCSEVPLADAVAVFVRYAIFVLHGVSELLIGRWVDRVFKRSGDGDDAPALRGRREGDGK